MNHLFFVKRRRALCQYIHVTIPDLKLFPDIRFEKAKTSELFFHPPQHSSLPHFLESSHDACLSDKSLVVTFPFPLFLNRKKISKSLHIGFLKKYIWLYIEVGFALNLFIFEVLCLRMAMLSISSVSGAYILFLI